MDIKNAIISKVYNASPLEVDDVYNTCQEWAEKLFPYVAPVESIVHDALQNDKKVLLEGAQGVLLDLDHGTYPFVTSSYPSIGGACIGLGISPQKIIAIVGVFKAYTTRVGGGPFPTELFDDVGNAIRERAWEYGTTTGRPRRCGWFDAVAAKYSAKVNGFTSIVLTRLDVLDGFSPKVCVAYKLDGKIVDEFPAGIGALDRCEPIFEEYESWKTPTESVTNVNNLPKEAMKYVKRLEELIGSPVNLISTGPKRHETVVINPLI
jgi:adenylosuccinate synthase